MELTPRMEDFIQAIWELEQEKKVVRVRDLERYFMIKTASVVEFARNLKKRGMINHEKYGYIELTDAGVVEAERIYKCRLILQRFFTEVVGVGEQVANKEACSCEHYIQAETLALMESLTGFFAGVKFRGKLIKELFQEYRLNHGVCTDDHYMHLSELQPGDTGKIVKVLAKGEKKRTLAELGFVVGVPLALKSISPLGDPVEIEIQDSSLSLRKADAALVLVEKNESNSSPDRA